MSVTPITWAVAITGLLLMAIIVILQFVALLKPRGAWTIRHVYGGSPDNTDPKAYFAFNRGFAIADTVFWGPLQVAGSIGMLMGERWGFLLGLIASVPFWYSAVLFYVWDRDLGFRQDTLVYWVFVWGMFPVFGVVEMVYCFIRLV
jgi:hypothetical protein